MGLPDHEQFSVDVMVLHGSTVPGSTACEGTAGGGTVGNSAAQSGGLGGTVDKHAAQRAAQ